ncbi:MAG TPA: BatD family protein [Malonomonas sp.]
MVAARVFLVALVSLFILQSTPVFSAEIKVFVDQDLLLVNQSFQLFFEATGSVDADPDFAPLERDFEIRGHNQSSSTSIINGSYSSKKTWILTLLAKTSGTLVIPAVSFGSDSSPPLILTINATDSHSQSDKAADIFLEVNAEPKTAYVQQRLTYSVKLFRRVEITNASLSEPEFSNIACNVEKLGTDREFETIHNGRRYLVFERQYAVFPQQSGDLLIKPIRFEGQLLQSQRSFFGAVNQAGPIQRLQSEAFSYKIKPIPKSFQGKYWLPAEKLQLSESWSKEPSQLVVGEPTTRTLTLAVQGLQANQLPKLPTLNLPGFKLYPDQALLENDLNKQPAVSLRQEKLALIPTQMGDFQLPEIRIDWWNTLTDSPETVFLPTTTLRVKAPLGGQPHDVEIKSIPPQQATAATSEAPSETSPVESLLWPLLTTLLASGWLATILAWWRSSRRPAKQNLKTNLQTSVTQAEKRLKSACQRSDPALAKSALLDWGNQIWRERPSISLTEIGKACGVEVAKEIETLNRALYAQGSRDWNGAKLWQAFKQKGPSTEVQRNKKASPLKDLHP